MPRRVVTMHFDKSPGEVLSFIADVRNRTKYLPSLKDVVVTSTESIGENVQWKWRWEMMGLELAGDARCTGYVPGREYRFETSGGITSAWRYHAVSSNAGTELTIEVQYDLSEDLAAKLPPEDQLNKLLEEEVQTISDRLRQALAAG